MAVLTIVGRARRGAGNDYRALEAPYKGLYVGGLLDGFFAGALMTKANLTRVVELQTCLAQM